MKTEARLFQAKFMPLVLGGLTIILLVAGCATPVTTPTGTSAHTPVLPTLSSTPPPSSTVTVEPTLSARELHLIYDDDGSRDGLAALLYLLGQPGISVQAITISYGEAHPQRYIQHIGRLLDDFGIQDIPLGAGQDAPLSGGTPFPGWLRQLSDNFWDVPLPNADRTYPVQSAPELLVSILNQASEPVTIFLSGTFTNLAQALRLDPGIRENIAAVYFMGGAVYVPGNITNLIPDSENLVSEWNIYADPLAAWEVFGAGLDLYMVPLDATNQVILTQEETLPWHQGDEKADLAADLYDVLFNDYGFESVEIFDLTASVLMVRPALCDFQPLHLDVITDEGNTSGQTIVIPNGEPNIHVCLQPDVDSIKQEQNDTFLGTVGSLEIPSIEPTIGTWTGSVSNNGFEMQASITIGRHIS